MPFMLSNLKENVNSCLSPSFCYISGVILCPYCQQSLEETSPSCPSCQVDLQKVNKLLGPPPFLNSHLSDFTNHLKKREFKSIERALFIFSRTFPQCRFAVLLRTFPQDVPLRIGLFWIFNSGAISDASSDRGENRDVLFAIDPTFNRSGIMVGYGLEPFFSRKFLDSILLTIKPYLKQRLFAKASLLAIREVSIHLEKLSTSLPSQFGIENPNLALSSLSESPY